LIDALEKLMKKQTRSKIPDKTARKIIKNADR